MDDRSFQRAIIGALLFPTMRSLGHGEDEALAKSIALADKLTSLAQAAPSAVAPAPPALPQSRAEQPTRRDVTPPFAPSLPTPTAPER